MPERDLLPTKYTRLAMKFQTSCLKAVDERVTDDVGVTSPGFGCRSSALAGVSDLPLGERYPGTATRLRLVDFSPRVRGLPPMMYKSTLPTHHA
jgi:hypothetical protein